MFRPYVDDRPRKKPKAKRSRAVEHKYLYAMECAGFVKFGVASDVGKRLSGIQTGTPLAVTVLAKIYCDTRIEKHLHRHLRALRVRGEWFQRSQRVQELIDLMSKGNVERFLAFLETPSQPPAFKNRLRSAFEGHLADESDFDDSAVLGK